MDPLSFLVEALTAGAAASTAGVAEIAIQDAYAGVKQWIQVRYAGVDLAGLEKKPDSQARQAVVKEELAGAGADQDAELLRKVQALTEALAQSEAGRRAAQVVGVKLENLRVDKDLRIADVESSGSGVQVKDSNIGGDLDIRGVRAGKKPGDAAPNP